MLKILPMKKYIFILSGVVLLSAFALFGLPGDKLEAAENAELWNVRCNDGEKEVKRGACEVFQRLVVTETQQRLVEFAVGFPEGKEEARGIVVLPLGILLQPGVEMVIDKKQPLKFNVRYCDPNGCFAYVSLNEAVLNMLRKGDNISIVFQSPKPQKIQVDMSLKGFSKALKEVS